ncbi:MAG: AbrB/MazE/SpoVT family DNA-binding domain-containing protein [Thermoplasmatota archaeon]
MDPAVVKVHYPNGSLPVRGFRCPRNDGEERILGGDLAEANEVARTLGLYAAERTDERKLIQAGNSTAVTIPAEILSAVLGPGAHVGEKVNVSQIGKRIIIEATEA